MNKHLISEGSAQLSKVLIEEYDGFECGQHKEENTIGYWCGLINDISEEWNTKGHGYTYDQAIVSLYLLVKKNELPLTKDAFLTSKFYLEN